MMLSPRNATHLAFNEDILYVSSIFYYMMDGDLMDFKPYIILYVILYTSVHVEARAHYSI